MNRMVSSRQIKRTTKNNITLLFWLLLSWIPEGKGVGSARIGKNRLNGLIGPSDKFPPMTRGPHHPITRFHAFDPQESHRPQGGPRYRQRLCCRALCP